MNHEEFSALIKDYQLGKLTPEQKKILDKWFEIIETNSDEVWTMNELERLREKVMKQITVEEQNRRSFFRLSRRWLPYAAAILLICLGGLYYYQTTVLSIEDRSVHAGKSSIENGDSIPPGGNKATLTLADGRTIALSDDHTGIIVGEKLVYDDGTVLLDGSKEANPIVDDYQLTTPRGGQYKMTLPDGSRVWLNAESTLKYPSRFVGSVRKVELTGEAYFEVTNDKNKAQSVPFVVKTASQEVVVLGTQFNIAAYVDEEETRTTLVKGAVMVRQPPNGRTQKEIELKLIPGEESVLTSSGIQTRKANLVSSTAWKSGIFAFDSIPFNQMMKQIARWYNIDVVYEGQIPQEQFKGKMSRNVNLKVLISFLRDSGINLRIEGRTLYIGR